jgi:hypothetical protein
VASSQQDLSSAALALRSREPGFADVYRFYLSHKVCHNVPSVKLSRSKDEALLTKNWSIVYQRLNRALHDGMQALRYCFVGSI